MNFKEEFDKLDLKKCLMVGLCLCVFYWLLMFDSGSTVDAQVIAARQKITKNQTVLLQVRKAVEDQKKFENEIQTITRNMRDFQKYFATDIDSNGLQEKVSNLAEKHKLLVNGLKPISMSSEFPNYQQIGVEIRIQGTFHNVMEFISSLTQLEKAIDFNKMHFRSMEDGTMPQVELETVLVLYSSNDIQQEEGNG